MRRKLRQECTTHLRGIEKGESNIFNLHVNAILARIFILTAQVCLDSDYTPKKDFDIYFILILWEILFNFGLYFQDKCIDTFKHFVFIISTFILTAVVFYGLNDAIKFCPDLRDYKNQYSSLIIDPIILNNFPTQ